MEDMVINETDYPLKDGTMGKLAVFIYAGYNDPSEMLDKAIKQYVGDNGYYEFIQSDMCNPWTRVIMSDINHIYQKEFDEKKHRIEL